MLEHALGHKIVLCSPLTLFAVLAVVRQAVDSFQLERTTSEILDVLGSFSKQWEAFVEQMDTLDKRLESTRRDFDELSGTRRRKLERELDRIDDLRRSKELVAADERPGIAEPPLASRPEPGAVGAPAAGTIEAMALILAVLIVGAARRAGGHRPGRDLDRRPRHDRAAPARLDPRGVAREAPGRRARPPGAGRAPGGPGARRRRWSTGCCSSIAGVLLVVPRGSSPTRSGCCCSCRRCGRWCGRGSATGGRAGGVDRAAGRATAGRRGSGSSAATSDLPAGCSRARGAR